MHLKILAWNMWGIPTENLKRRSLGFIEALAATNADICFVEEAWTAGVLRRLKKLDGYAMIFTKRRIQRGPDGGLVTLIRKGLLQGPPTVNFKRYRLPRRLGRLSPGGMVELIGEWVGIKGVQHVAAPIAGRMVHLLNTHLFCPNPAVPPSKLSRIKSKRLERQMTTFSEYVSALPDEPVVIGGDFNIPEGSDYYEQLLSSMKNGARRRLRDLSYGLAVPDFPGYDARIDFVFGDALRSVKDRYYIEPAWNGGPALSDHPGVVVEGELA